ncbi:hypothetical protein VO57_015110 [Citromicrobium bathyomarinum]|nr:hypothetical protein [Citromicrobium sp. JL2201]
MPKLLVTSHAIMRYQERVENVPAREVCARLNAPVFQRASEFGARYVKLAGLQRVVILEGRVITVLPSGHAPGSLAPSRDALHDGAGGDG